MNRNRDSFGIKFHKSISDLDLVLSEAKIIKQKYFHSYNFNLKFRWSKTKRWFSELLQDICLQNLNPILWFNVLER